MSIYYIGSIPYSSELYHHGVKGQRWGVRRYQNPDGTLTAAGRKRYGEDFGSGNSHSILRRIATGDHFLGMQRHRDKREDRLGYKIDKRKEKGKDTKRLEAKYEAQKKKNTDLANYVSNTSTGKLWAQNFLLTGLGADAYRSARARGEDRIVSFVESMLPIGSFIAGVSRASGDIDKYGRLTHSV